MLELRWFSPDPEGVVCTCGRDVLLGMLEEHSGVGGVTPVRKALFHVIDNNKARLGVTSSLTVCLIKNQAGEILN